MLCRTADTRSRLPPSIKQTVCEFRVIAGRARHDWAWTSTNTTVFNLAGTQIGDLSTSSQGWTLGGGAEWMFAPHWSVFAEYNFMGFGGSNIQDMVAGVNYKF